MLLLFVGRYKVSRLHEQMLAPAGRLQLLSSQFSCGSSCLLKMLAINGSSDSCWTLEWLNKRRRWASLLWVSRVSHLFIAPKLNSKTLLARLALIHCLCLANMMPCFSASIPACCETEALILHLQHLGWNGIWSAKSVSAHVTLFHVS